MPKFLEQRLKREAAKKGLTGKRADAYTYGTMNNIGAMKGNKETLKGKRMEQKHAQTVRMGGPNRNALRARMGL